jgi:hypothetical protein
MMNKKAVDVLLVALILLDVIYDIVIFSSPDTWFRVVHGASNIDPQGLLRRTAGVWAAFTLWQTIALFRWKKGPHWLMLVAGIRWTEIFADWTYLYFAHSITTVGRLGLLSAAPVNLLCGWFFYRSYFKATQPQVGQAPSIAKGSSAGNATK